MTIREWTSVFININSIDSLWVFKEGESLDLLIVDTCTVDFHEFDDEILNSEIKRVELIGMNDDYGDPAVEIEIYI